MIKAILSDFDGTLVDQETKYHPNVKDLIHKLAKKGVRFSVATGRSWVGRVGKTITELDIDGIHIFNGGAVIYDTVKKERLWYKPLSPASAKNVISYLLSKNLVFAVERENITYLSHEIEIPFFMNGVTCAPLADLKACDDIVKIMTFTILNDLSPKTAEDHIKTIEKDSKDITVLRFPYKGKTGFDITSEYASKHTAILEYQKMLGLAKEEVVGIGNDHNDYPMFMACGYTIAMADSPAELKEIAHHVVTVDTSQNMAIALTHLLEEKVL